MGYHVVLKNSLGCELDGRFAANEEEIKGAVIALAKDVIFADGDVIRIIEEIDMDSPNGIQPNKTRAGHDA